MGTPDFAVPSLESLLDNGYDVVGVVTAPDRKGGRGMDKVIKSAVKQFAEGRGLKILQPTNLKSTEFHEELKDLAADLQVVVAFRMLPEIVWNMPPLGTMNLHGSLLPKYRGAAPIHWAVIKGETVTGLTTFLLKHQIDTGDILLQVRIEIGDDETTGELHDKMMVAGAKLVLESVRQIATGNYDTQPQDGSLATKAPKIHHEDARINFHAPLSEVYNFIRGMSPYPAAWTLLDGMQLKIIRAEKIEKNHKLVPGIAERAPGERMLISVEGGYIEPVEVKLEGKRKMRVDEFLRGYKGELTLG